ncbi:MAG: hypothetical protein ACREFQ_15470, partial [Stellaceae bacterium]
DTIETGLIGAANGAEWPYYVGIHKNFFAEASINLDVVYVPTASGLVQQVAAGSSAISARWSNSLAICRSARPTSRTPSRRGTTAW